MDWQLVASYFTVKSTDIFNCVTIGSAVSFWPRKSFSAMFSKRDTFREYLSAYQIGVFS